MDPNELVALFENVANGIGEELRGLDNFGLVEGSSEQYQHDVVADQRAVQMLLDGGLGVVSEESGVHASDRSIMAVVDPIDGSTNASHHLSYFNTSIAAVDDEGLLACLVRSQATSRTWAAIRGGGAYVDSYRIMASHVTAMDQAIIAFNDLPPAHLGWRQFRVMGATALDLAHVAQGNFDAFGDASAAGNSPWDYLAGVLLVREAGGMTWDLDGQELVTIEHSAKRKIFAAGNQQLADQLHDRFVAARQD